MQFANVPSRLDSKIAERKVRIKVKSSKSSKRVSTRREHPLASPKTRQRSRGWFKLPEDPSVERKPLFRRSQLPLFSMAASASSKIPSVASTSRVTLDAHMLSTSGTDSDGEEEYTLPPPVQTESTPFDQPMTPIRGVTKGDLTIETAPNSDDVWITYKGVDYFLTKDLFEGLRLIHPTETYDCGPVPGLHQAVFNLRYLRDIDTVPVRPQTGSFDPKLVFKESALVVGRFGTCDRMLWSDGVQDPDFMPYPDPELPTGTPGPENPADLFPIV
ncbi:hypothetical protein BDN72DRAFT_931962 [Pluteus cervinus]|uniref:Uncharacterized protein n=1 Tax=Pluteus cervinus TaxID=181527 RepID=A0ACD3AAD2_9AGAR|nr:hypothetical protein BDN72DRAFT_931962 [Pluteus cervinus]